jgi:hypothetical protein
MVRRDARIVVTGDSKILEATDAALELLDLTFDQLRALPPGSLSLEADRAATAGFEAAWDGSGRGEIVGSGSVKLLDGRLLRIRYLITPLPDGIFEIIIERADESVSEPPRMYTVGSALSAWRAAERKLEKVAPGSDEWTAVQSEIAYFRAEYQRVARGASARSPD